MVVSFPNAFIGGHGSQWRVARFVIGYRRGLHLASLPSSFSIAAEFRFLTGAGSCRVTDVEPCALFGKCGAWSPGWPDRDDGVPVA